MINKSINQSINKQLTLPDSRNAPHFGHVIERLWVRVTINCGNIIQSRAVWCSEDNLQSMSTAASGAFWITSISAITDLPISQGLIAKFMAATGCIQTTQDKCEFPIHEKNNKCSTHNLFFMAFWTCFSAWFMVAELCGKKKKKGWIDTDFHYPIVTPYLWICQNAKCTPEL